MRHGRTALNAVGALRGRADVPLDETGRQQAQALGELFRGITVSGLVSSPLLRATETAAAVAEATGTLTVIDERLADRDYGPWNGKSSQAVLDRYASVERAPGVEPYEQFAGRVLAGFFAAATGTTPAPIVIVAHDVVNRLLLGPHLLAGVAPAELAQPTGCWNRMELGECGWTAPVVGALPGDGRHP
ncbi:MAG: histidine phosphatase family protein [Acidimicrobiales bacterium]